MSSSSTSRYGGVLGDGSYHHRSDFRVGNKPFKGKSKGKQQRANRGKVSDSAPRASVKSVSCSHSNSVSRANRSKQMQSEKREQILRTRRIGSADGPPRIVALVPLASNLPTEALLDSLTRQCMDSDSFSSISCPAHQRLLSFGCGSRPQRFLFSNTPRTTDAVLDIGKVADIIIFLFGVNGLGVGEDQLVVDGFGQHCLSLLKAQGMNSCIAATLNLHSALNHQLKSIQEVKKLAVRFVHTALDKETKLVHLECGEGESAPNANPSEMRQLFRWLGEMKIKSIKWRDERSYMLASHVEYDSDKLQLSIRGFLRGNRNLNANHLIHITGHGDFQISTITGRKECNSSNPTSNQSRKNSLEKEKENVNGESKLSSNRTRSLFSFSDSIVLHASDPSKRDSLDGLQAVNPLSHEQSIISEEEFNQDSHDFPLDSHDPAMDVKQEPVSNADEMPHSKGDIQSAWNAALGIQSDSESDSNGDKKQGNHTQTSMEDDWVHDPQQEEEEEEKSLESCDVRSVSELERDALDFPDEVEYSKDTCLKDRFSLYRGLKSFRHSAWDPKENLPMEYSQIYQFANFTATQHTVRKPEYELDPDTGIVRPVGVSPFRSQPITIHVPDVQASQAHQILSHHVSCPLVLFSLFSHERKVSVLHFHVSRHEWDVSPVKSGQPMQFHVGFRRFVSCPIYSHNSNPAKNLTMRYWPRGTFAVASVYARIQFPPAPVIMIRPQNEEALLSKDLSAFCPVFASGTLLSVDPDRLLIKRAILTGSPISVHKRFAVVRHMFFNAEDVNWFKPVELRTKQGMVGHITESRGTKGYMKCLFDGHIQQNDVVCMHLYKRQFPHWDPNQFTGSL